MTFADFHFLRPEWLLALFPAALLIAYVARRRAFGAAPEWAGLVDAHLLRHLTISGAQVGQSRWLPVAFGAGLIASVMAMAGPTWQKQPMPAFQGDAPSVIVLSLAQSMNSTDLVPSRLTRAGHKLRDMLDRATGDDVAFVIYADRPFVAAPLTSDADVIQQMLPELSTSLMPVLGNRLDLAITEGQALLDRAAASAGRIVVLADGMGLNPDASVAAARAAQASGYTLNVLGVGTTGGATLQTANGRAIQTRDGQNVTVTLDTDGLTALAQAGGGTFAAITADDSDLARVFPDQSGDLQGVGEATDYVSDGWADIGYFLLFIPVLLAPLAFRRGLILVFAFGIVGLGAVPQGAQAGVWEDLWQTPDQQAQAAFNAGNFAAAAGLATTGDARGAALYRNADFGSAAAQFGTDDYNRGNALAKSGAFEEALAAYDARLAVAPQDADAQFNRDIVAKLLEQQQQDQQQDQQEQQDESQQSQGQDMSEQDQSGQDEPQDQSGQNDPQDKSGQQQGGDAPQDQDQQGGQQPSDAADGQAGEQPQDQASDGQPFDGQSQEGGQQGEPQEQAQSQGQPAQGAQDQTGQPESTAEAATEPQAGAEEQQADTGTQSTENQTDQTSSAGDQSDEQGNAFTQLMDQMLGNSGEQPQETDDPTASGQAMATLNQAAEQQLRRVPDDPSGLLRARIRQHYDSLRAGQN